MVKLEVSTRGIIAIALVLVAAWTLMKLWPVILLVLIALILMMGILPYLEALVRLGVPRQLAVFFLVVAFLTLFAGLIAYMVPALVDEFSNVRDNLPESARQVEVLLAKFGVDVELQDRARNIDWGHLLSGRSAINYGQRVLTVVVSLISVIVMTAYLLADTPQLGRFVNQFIPDDRKQEAEGLFLALTRVVGGYLRGQLITSLAIAVYTYVLLRVMGVENPLAFAVLAAFADIIPLVGSVLATLPPVAAALQTSSTTASIVLIALVGYQQFEDRILAPRVYGRTLNLPAIIVLVAVLAGAELLGIVGVLIALPLAAAARVAVDFMILNRRIPLVSEGTEHPFAPDEPPAGHAA